MSNEVSVSKNVLSKAFKDMDRVSSNKLKSGIKGKDVKPKFFDNVKIDNKKIDAIDIRRDQGKINKDEGRRREMETSKDLEKKYPEKEGYKILSERELCNRKGDSVKDEETGKKRRVDFTVVKDGKVVDMVEVTSKTAPKQEQLQKEYRIRANGGNYVKDKEGNLYRIPNNVETRVERRD